MFKSGPSPIDELIFPQLDNHVRFVEYELSRNFDLSSGTKNIYNVPNSIVLEYIKCVKSFQEANERLKVVRLRESKLTVKIDAEWKKLENNQLDFRKSIVNFNDFVIANHEKRCRAFQKIHDEKMNYQRRCEDEKVLSEKLKLFHYIKSRREEQIKAYKIYEIFLDNAMNETNKEFSNISTIITRYEVLCDTKLDILHRQTLQLQELELIKEKKLEMVEKKSLILIKLRGDVMTLQIRYDKAKQEALRWENILTEIKLKITNLIMDFDNISYSCNNVYSTICRRTRQKLNFKAPFEKKYAVIKKRMQILEKILQNLNSNKTVFIKKMKKY